MKTWHYRSFNSISRIFILIIVTFVLTIASCKSPERKKSVNKEKISKKMEQVKSDLHDVIILEKNEMETQADSVITDFNNKLDKLEAKMKKGNNKLNSKSEEVLNKLKAERDTLSMKLNKIENETDKNWDNLKTELNHDIQRFSSGVKDFFRKNK